MTENSQTLKGSDKQINELINDFNKSMIFVVNRKLFKRNKNIKKVSYLSMKVSFLIQLCLSFPLSRGDVLWGHISGRWNRYWVLWTRHRYCHHRLHLLVRHWD